MCQVWYAPHAGLGKGSSTHAACSCLTQPGRPLITVPSGCRPYPRHSPDKLLASNDPASC
eukprot:163206-Chlamydomonas_euryale.AAC.3